MEIPSARLRECLLDKETFQQLSLFFIAKAEEEAIQEAPDSVYSKVIKSGLEILSYENSTTVFTASESPIETIFLNSLTLCFIRHSLPLVMIPNVADVPSYTSKFRLQLSQLRDFIKWYKERNGDWENIDAYLDGEVKRGAMLPEEPPLMRRWLLLYEWLNFGTAYHLVVQASFPQIKVDGKSIRTDLFVWVPDNEDFNLVVECDGFQFHSNREAFTKDRKRDRILQSQSFQTMRFSGIEIHGDPAGVANELFDHLYERMKA